ncbi:MAG: hypothetical protein LHW50_07350 [Candidatus Cloacimonetes bacterium]|nr:hypothetical protein [Candidatus Cloacimonadota bacterium]MCK9515602.1 hypothetical protein [Ottowia sp.]
MTLFDIPYLEISVDSGAQSILRALSASPVLPLLLEDNLEKKTNDSLISQLTYDHTKITDQNLLRGSIDILAVEKQFHDPETHKNLRSFALDVDLYDCLECARIEVIGANVLPGVASNIYKLRLHEYRHAMSNERSSEVLNKEIPFEIVREWLFEKLTLSKTFKKSPHRWKTIGKSNDMVIDNLFLELKKNIKDQRKFGSVGLSLITYLSNVSLNRSLKSERRLSAQLNNRNRHSRRNLAELPSAKEGSENNRDNIDNISEGLECAEGNNLRETLGSCLEDFHDLNRKQKQGIVKIAHRKSDYYFYTNEFDVEAEPTQLIERRRLKMFRAVFDDKCIKDRRILKQMTHILRKKLEIRKISLNRYNSSGDILNTRKLSDFITNSKVDEIYQKRDQRYALSTAITILIDNSGSMRGRPLFLAAMSADFLAATLERYGIAIELLGFTTCEWNGGRSKKKWRQEGERRMPGRLNDLCHIIYKPYSKNWYQIRDNLGIILDDGLPKENIDGEALLWAYSRIRKRSELRRVLIVLSDGLPSDNTSQNINNSDYLVQHLKYVIKSIERDPKIELIGIGLKHEIGGLYKKVAKIDKAENIGPVLARVLSEKIMV